MSRGSLLGSVASAAFLASVGPARADPFSLTAILATAITAATGATGIGVTAIATIASGALTIGAGYLLASLFSSVPKPENGTVATQQPIPFRPYAYGTCAPPGMTLHREASAGFLGVVNCIAAHQIDDFIGLYLNDDSVVILQDGSGDVTGYSSSATDGRYQNGYIFLDSRKGVAGQGYMGMFSGNFASTWPTTSTGQGLALFGMICASPPKSKANLFTTIFPYAEPKPRPVIRAALIFDPRAPGQDPNNPSTWSWSDNAALLLLHWRCFSPFGSQLDYATAILPNLAAWIQAANDCDDAMPLKSGGTERRYRAGGWNTTEQDRRSTTAALLAACDGWMVDRGDGTVDVKVGKYVAPTVTLTDDDILGFMLQRDKATKDAVNRITAKYTSPDNHYVSVETDPMDNLADQALRFGPVRAAQMDVTWCQSTGQASRLQKREFIRQGKKLRGSLVLGLSGLNAPFERWVLIRSNTIPNLSGLVVEVSRPRIDIIGQRVTIDFVESGPDIDTYDPAVDESDYPFVPEPPLSTGLPVTANVAAVYVSPGSLTVSWDAPIVDGSVNYTFSYIVQTRVAAAGGSPPGPWVQQEFFTPTGSGRISVTTSGGATAASQAFVDVQVITESSSGQFGAGSTIIQVAMP